MASGKLTPEDARREGLGIRSRVGVDESRVRSAEVAFAIAHLNDVRPPGRMAIHRALPGEVDLRSHESDLRDAGWTLFLPRTISDHELEFAEYDSDADLTAGRFGIDEPENGMVVPAVRLDVVICPCVAVDLEGTRVGFGAGYYDRALGQLSGESGVDRPVFIGIAWDAQVLPPIQRAKWDIPMDLIVTETRIIRPGD